MKEIALGLFGLTYICLLVFPKYRSYLALGSAFIFVVLGILPVGKILTAVDWNVILMIAGTMGIVSLFIESKMPSLLADIILDRMPDVRFAIIALALFAGFISAFVDNVATVLMVAPVAVDIAKKLKISPVNAIIAIAVSSNLQGAATLVGDTTSILLGGAANMNFMDFIFYQGRIGIFWVVQAGAITSAFILYFIFRKDKQPIHLAEKTKVTDFFPSYLLLGMIGLLIGASFIPETMKFPEINGFICVTLMIIGLIREGFFKKNPSRVVSTFLELDVQTILLLASLFVIIGGIKEAGVITDISNLFVRYAGNNLFTIYTLIVFASVFISAFIDNIPYVATMLPVVASIATQMNVNPTILYFGLLIGATLGGNMTPIGASANIAGLGILRKEGYEVKSGTFMRIGIPFTIVAVLTGYILIWLIWA
jgi:Na+/H+ antiporter NhaD/arsenite permease-like protein